MAADERPNWGRVCVTGSVAVGSERYGQDATGHNSIIWHYPPSRADFTGKIANSTKRPDQFFKTEVRKTSAFCVPKLASSHPADISIPDVNYCQRGGPLGPESG